MKTLIVCRVIASCFGGPFLSFPFFARKQEARDWTSRFDIVDIESARVFWSLRRSRFRFAFKQVRLDRISKVNKGWKNWFEVQMWVNTITKYLNIDLEWLKTTQLLLLKYLHRGRSINCCAHITQYRYWARKQWSFHNVPVRQQNSSRGVL